MFNIINKIINIVTQSIAAFGISAGVALAFGNVVVRYILNGSLTWAAELTTYLFLWSTFFGATYCFKEDAHISIDILLQKVKPITAKYLVLLSYTITLIFLSAVSYYGYEYLLLVIDLEETSVDLEIPMWIPYLVIPVSFAFSAYMVMEHLVKLIYTPSQDLEFKSEVDELLKEANLKDVLEEAKRKSGGLV